MTDFFKKISQELSIAEKQVRDTWVLLEEGGSIPFIARYRKEATGGLDEVLVAQVRDRMQALQELEKRREAILKSLQELGKLDAALELQVRDAESLSRLEDLYLPYKPKRKTKASVARERGLEPLATLVFQQETADPLTAAEAYVSEEKGVPGPQEALNGARDIIAEIISEHIESRESMRQLFLSSARFISRMIEGKEALGEKYKDYFDWAEPLKTAPSHRVLAMRRGEKEGILSLEIRPLEEEATALLIKRFVKNQTASGKIVEAAAVDAYKRLLGPSMETEIRIFSRKKADEEAVRVFAENVRQLLLAAPLGSKRVMAIDPGFRTGCKVVCLDEQGKLLENTTIQPHTGALNAAESEQMVRNLCTQYRIEAIGIGNGTAGRETEVFIRSLGLEGVLVIMVNESGASIYSASDLAREEFPDKDLTVRGAVSIGRRLIDPLAELVKLDPKSIGVGQYQHDVDQGLLQASLDDTVTSCVNRVGVELNTASRQILGYVSGLGPALAQNIIEYRNENGAFKSRTDLRKVPRLGEKAFEQAAGFLRIQQGVEILDSSAVHPERYALVGKMAADLGVGVTDLMADASLRKKIQLENYLNEEVGLPTLNDILAELAKPGRDPRDEFEAFAFTDGVKAITDLKVGMKLPGIVTNITAFGAFVDIGVHQDGLVHLSQLAGRFVKDPNEVVKVQQKVQVTVTEVDIERKRIALSMKPEEKPREKSRNRVSKPGSDKGERGQAAGKSGSREKPSGDKAQKEARSQKPSNQPRPNQNQGKQQAVPEKRAGELETENRKQNHRPDYKKNDARPDQRKPGSQPNRRPLPGKENPVIEEKDSEEDMAAKLAALKAAFNRR